MLVVDPARVLRQMHKGSQELTGDWNGDISLALGLLDVEAVPDNRVANVAEYWSRSMSTASVLQLLRKDRMTADMVRDICWCGVVAFRLHLRLEKLKLPSLEPIFAFLGCSYDLFNECELEGDYPVRFISWDKWVASWEFLSWSFSETGNFFNRQTCLTTVISLLAFLHKLPITSAIFDFVDSFQETSGCISHEQFLAAKETGKFAEPIPASNSAEVNLPTCWICSLLRVIERLKWEEEKREFFSTFEEVRPAWTCKCLEKAKCDFTMPPAQFLSSMLNGQMIVDKQSFVEIPAEASMSVWLYALYVNIETPFINELLSLQLTDEMKEALRAKLSCSAFSKTPDELVGEPDSVIAARSLLRLGGCLEKLTDSRLHRILAILCAKEVELKKDPEISEFTVAALLWHVIHRKHIEQDVLKGILRKVSGALAEMTPEKDRDIVMSNTAPFYDKKDLTHANLPLPSKCMQVLCEKPPNLGILCSWVTYLCVLLGLELDTEGLLVDISLNWFANGANRDYLQKWLLERFDSSFLKLRNEKLQSHVLAAIENAPSKPDIITHLKDVLVANNSATAAVLVAAIHSADETAILALNEVNPDGVARATSSGELASWRTGFIECFIKLDKPDPAVKVIEVLSCSGNDVFATLGRLLASYPKTVGKILRKLDLSPQKVVTLLENMTDIPQQIDQSLVNVLAHLMGCLTPPSKGPELELVRPRKMNVRWEDDRVVKRTKSQEELDLWEFPTRASRCEGHVSYDRPMFYCYTCGLASETQRICQACAELCHANHDVFYVGLDSCNCACGSGCRAKQEELPPLKSPSNHTEVSESTESLQPRPSVCLDLFLHFASCSMKAPEEVHYVPRLSQEVSKWQMKQLPCQNVTSAVNFRKEIGTVRFDYSAFVAACQSSLNHQSFVRKMEVSPITLVAVAGLEKDLLLIAEGNTLNAVRISGELVCSYHVPFVILQICVCPLDSSVFALASLDHAAVYSISAESGVQPVNEVELMLETLGSGYFVNRIFWVPNTPLYLGVVCNAFVKIYDIPNDGFCPICCLMPDSGDFVTSCDVVSYNDEAYCLIGLNSRRIAIQSTNVEGPVQLERFLKLGRELGSLMTLSVAEEDDLLFITAPDCNMGVLRLSEVLNPEQNTPQVCAVTLPRRENWTLIHSQGPLFFFQSPSKGSVMTLEITDDAFEVAMVTKAFTSTLGSVADNDALVSSCFVGDDFCMLSGAGKMLRMSYEPDKHDVPESGNGSAAEDRMVIPVPPSFWTRSNRTKEGVLIRYPEAGRELNGLLSFNRFIFRQHMHHKVLRITSVNPNQVIVGLQVFVGSNHPRYRPPWLKLNGYRVNVNAQRGYQLPVDPGDIGSPIELEFAENEGNEINCDGIVIYTIDKDKVPEKYLKKSKADHSWWTDAQSVFDIDFDRNCLPAHLGEIVCGWAELFRLRDEDPELDEESIRRLVRVMYTHADYSDACRFILSKGVRDRDNGVVILADEMKRMADEKAIHPGMWIVVWRDMLRLPKDIVTRISNSVWAAAPNPEGEFSVICAFSS